MLFLPLNKTFIQPVQWGLCNWCGQYFTLVQKFWIVTSCGWRNAFFNTRISFIPIQKFIHSHACQKMLGMKPLCFSFTVYFLVFCFDCVQMRIDTSADCCDLSSYCCFDSYFIPFSPQENNQSSPLTLVSRPTDFEYETCSCWILKNRCINISWEMWKQTLVSYIVRFLFETSRLGFQVNCIFKESRWFIQVTLDCGGKSKHTFTYRQHFYFYSDLYWLEALQWLWKLYASHLN